MAPDEREKVLEALQSALDWFVTRRAESQAPASVRKLREAIELLKGDEDGTTD